MSNAQLVKNAQHVEILNVNNVKSKVDLRVNDTIVRLDRRHPIATAASLTSNFDAAADLFGGHFVFEEDDKGNTHLKEWRDSNYSGFMQDQQFIDIYSNADLTARAKTKIEIGEYGAGGAFDISTGFTWSAFEQNLTTNLSLLRQICSNGAVMKSRLFEKEVPILNLHDRHLDIAANQMMFTAERMIKQRLEKMGREHSLNREVEMVSSHIERRLKAAYTNDERDRLVTINNALALCGNPTEFYTKEAINNGVYRELDSPISRLDLFNIATEVNSHSSQNVDSTLSAIDRISTGLIFPKDTGRVISEHTNKTTFGSPEQAFFGA